jgi:bacterioferritin (cytochrome b1)
VVEQNAEFLRTVRIIEAIQNYSQDLLVIVEIERQLIRRFMALLRIVSRLLLYFVNKMNPRRFYMAAPKAHARDRELLALLRTWKGVEASTIKSCDAILKKAKNPIMTTLTMAIKNDSEKHASILQLIIDSMTKMAYELSPDDLAGISSLLSKHIELEQESINTANKAIEMTRDAVTKQLLKLILEDEKRHKMMATRMSALKYRITAAIP